MDKSYLFFLVQVLLISLTGVLAPGPMTATALASGLQKPHAGTWLAIGHGIIEFPLMFLILLGIGFVFQYIGVQIAIGLLGGLCLAWMGRQMFLDAKKGILTDAAPQKRHPLTAGIILSAANPYFLLWWATTGMNLTLQVKPYGLWAFIVFAAVHWLCDWFWLEILSYSSFKGRHLISPRLQQAILIACGAVLVFFAGKFIWNALQIWFTPSV